MTDKFENIESEEIQINSKGEIQLSAELEEAISGGFNPEEGNEHTITNMLCPCGHEETNF